MGVAGSDPAWRSLFAAFRGALAEAGWNSNGRRQPSDRTPLGAPVVRIGSGPWQESWSICGPTRSLGQYHAGDRRPRPRDADNSDRVRERIRSDRQWLRRELRAAGRQHHRLHGSSNPQLGGKWVELLRGDRAAHRACAAPVQPGQSAGAAPESDMPAIAAAARARLRHAGVAPLRFTRTA